MKTFESTDVGGLVSRADNPSAVLVMGYRAR